MLKKVKKIVIGAMITSLLMANIALAAGPTAVVTGEASVTIDELVVANFGAVALDGTTQTTTAAVTDMILTDARGTGDGWNVNLQATQFTSDTIDNIELNTLPEQSLALGTVSITVAEEGSTPVDTITIGSGALDTATGVDILEADINKGMGTYTISIQPLTLTLLPKDAKAGTYTSTITMTLSQGPTV